MTQVPGWDLSQSACNSDVYDDTASPESWPELPIMTSTSFFPGARGKESNLVLCSMDCLHFFMDSASISGLCPDAFKKEIAAASANYHPEFGPLIVYIPEPSTVLDVMLHFLEALAFPEDAPSLQILLEGVSSMPRYGIDPTLLLVPSNPCYKRIVILAPTNPLEVYAMAGSLDIFQLAAVTSSHLLSYTMKNINEEMAVRMGGAYLKKLSALHSHRREMLKSIMRNPPYPHPPTEECNFTRQKQLGRAWRMTAGYFVWESKSDLSPAVIQASFDNLKAYVECKDCQEMLENRVKEVISRWVLVRRTIE